MFSLPLNPKLNKDDFEKYYQSIVKLKDYIFDIYFTCRIPPFLQDAMGDLFYSTEDLNYLIDLAIFIQKITGVKISATFNNINISPSQENLDIFIKSFKPLYDAGIRSVTIPNSHWVATGQLQKEFPDLFIKNTILRNVTRANEIVDLANIGFNYINLDRDLMRDADSLLKIKKAKEYCSSIGKPVMISLLANEGCKGNCAFMDEHFCFNNCRLEGPQYLNSAISRVSCTKWDIEDKAIDFKNAIFSPWKEDWDKYLKEYGIDVFKLHGRENRDRLFESLGIIEKYSQNRKFLFESFEYFYNNSDKNSLDSWRNKIENCKFDCWSCGFCDKLTQKIPTTKEKLIISALNESALNNYNNNIQGLTSQRVKSFLNMLGKNSKKYLEIGTHNGATFCSAIDGNSLEAYAVDNWKENIQPFKEELTIEESSIQNFKMNLLSIDSNKNIIHVINKDMLKVDTSEIKNIDLFFYDGDHSYKSTYNALKYFYKCFSEETILIFDDANWDGVVDAVNAALYDLKANVIFKKILLNGIESTEQWWNGLYILIINKINYEKETFNKDTYNLILTKECNKKCSFCFTNGHDLNSEMSLDFINKLIDNFPEINGFKLLGGEPTSHSKFIEILNLLDKRNKKYELISNLLFSENILENILKRKNNCQSILANGMELYGDKFELFIKNWNELKNNFEIYFAFTITQYHTIEYFEKYCTLLKEKLHNIEHIRIGLDLNGDYIINNKQIGEIVKTIWNILADENTNIVFDCDVPPCIFDYSIEKLQFMTPNKYYYNSSCEGPIMDILHDGKVIYCYPLQDLKIDNIFDYDNMSDVFVDFSKSYYDKKRKIKPHVDCLKCDYYKKSCHGLCLACIK